MAISGFPWRFFRRKYTAVQDEPGMKNGAGFLKLSS
jgi:hypothetical protein